jgi:hypothetical protein
MPDLTEHTAYVCASVVDEFFENVRSGSTGGRHSVRYGELDPEDQHKQGCQYGFTCTCDGYLYRGYCKHIKQVAAKHCRWNACLDPGLLPAKEEETGDLICPECRGPIKTMRVAV